MTMNKSNSEMMEPSAITTNVHANISTLQNLNTSGEGSDYYYYYYYYDLPYKMDTKQWQVPIFAYLYTGIALLTIMVNIMVIFVFARRKMRSQTTFMLTVLACSDSVICFSVATYHIYFHLYGHYKDPVRYQWCIIKHALHVIEDIARSNSNWVTALLGVQRFVCICMPFRAKTLCSIKVSVVVSAVSLLVAISTYMYEAVSVKINPLPVMNGSEILFQSCIFEGGSKESVLASYVASGIIAKIIPCFVLLVTTVLLARKLYQRQRGIGGDVHDGDRSSKQMRRLNILVLLILVIFLLSELQDAVAFSIYAYELATDKVRQILSKEADERWDTIGNVLSLLEYHCNFWIFFLMSSQFRSALYETCSTVNRQQTTTASTRETLLSNNNSTLSSHAIRQRLL